MVSRLAAGLRILALVFLPYALVFSHRNATIVLLLIGLAGIGALRSYRPSGWSLALAAFALWASITVLWSPSTYAGEWPLYLLLFVVLSAAAYLSPIGRVRGVLAISITIALVLLTFEGVTDGLLRDIAPPENDGRKDEIATARGISIVLCLMPGFFLFLTRSIARPRLVIGLVSVLAIYLGYLFDVTANLLAALGLVAGFALAPRFPRGKVIGGLTVLIILPFLIMPILASALPDVPTMVEWEAGPMSWRARLVAWKAVWSAATNDLPGFLFGHGTEAARALGAGLPLVKFPEAPRWLTQVPTHPHNIWLQIYYDLGLVGVGLATLALVSGLRRLISADLPQPVFAAAIGLTLALAVYGLVDGSFWTAWRVAGALLGAWTISVFARDWPTDRGIR